MFGNKCVLSYQHTSLALVLTVASLLLHTLAVPVCVIVKGLFIAYKSN